MIYVRYVDYTMFLVAKKFGEKKNLSKIIVLQLSHELNINKSVQFVDLPVDPNNNTIHKNISTNSNSYLFNCNGE